MDLIMMEALAPVLAIGAVAGAIAWIANTWIRVKNGYPLDGAWGQAVYPKTDSEAKQQATLLARENAELRGELGTLKERLANVERIVTDRGYHLGAEIDALRAPAIERRKDEEAA